MDARFLPKLLLQHDFSPQWVLEDVHTAFLQALRARQVHAAVSPSGDGLAVALGQRLVVLRGLAAAAASASAAAASPQAGSSPGRSRSGGKLGAGKLVTSRGSSGGQLSVEFVTAVDEPESLTALAWIASAGGGSPAADECILAGTSSGCLQLHSPAAGGGLLLRQQLHHSPLLSATVRWSGSGSDPEDRSEDVTLCFADALARLPAWEVWAAVRWHSGRGGGAGGGWFGGGGGAGGGGGGGRGGGSASGAGHHHQLSFSKFQLPKGAGPRSHAVCLGPPPPSLYAALTGRPEGRRLRMLTAGVGPPLAAYEGEEAPSLGLLSLVSDLASSTAQSLLGAARSYVPGRSLLRGLRRGGGEEGGGRGGAEPAAAAAQQQQQQQRRAGQGQGQLEQGGKAKDKIPGEAASLVAAVWDEKRSVTQLALSPCGRLAACCDSLGRVLLVDANRTLVTRMLKGYRDAQVAWLVCGSGGSRDGGGGLGRGSSAGSSGGLRGGSGPAAGQQRGGSASSLGTADWEGGSKGGGDSLASMAGSTVEKAPSPEQQQQQRGQEAQPPAGGAEQAAADEPPGQQAEAAAAAAAAAAEPAAEHRRSSCCRHLLVTFAPRRAAVELWEPNTLTRLGSVKCSVSQGLLLQQPARRAGGGAGGAAAGSGLHAANRVLLLDGSSLTLTDLTADLAALL